MAGDRRGRARRSRRRHLARRASPTSGASSDFGIVEDYTGHGIGSAMHQPPNVPNVGRPGKGVRLVEGLALAVEPMVVAGEPWTHTLDDDWTVATDDGSLAAHFEHTFTLTPRGAWVLTALDGGEARLAELGVPYGGLTRWRTSGTTAGAARRARCSGRRSGLPVAGAAARPTATGVDGPAAAAGVVRVTRPTSCGGLLAAAAGGRAAGAGAAQQRRACTSPRWPPRDRSRRWSSSTPACRRAAPTTPDGPAGLRGQLAAWPPRTGCSRPGRAGGRSEDTDALFPDARPRAAVEREQRRLPLSYFGADVPTPPGWERLPAAYLALRGHLRRGAGARPVRGAGRSRPCHGRHLHQLVDPAGVAEAVLRLLRAARRD